MIKENIQSRSEELQDTSRETVSRAQGKAKSIMEDRKDQAATRLENVSKAFRITSRNMSSEDELVARYSGIAADQVDNLVNYLRSRDINTAIDQARQFARRRPDVFLTGAFAVGFLLSRFLKSSGPEYSTAGYEPGRTYGGSEEGDLPRGPSRKQAVEESETVGTGPGVGPSA